MICLRIGGAGRQSQCWYDKDSFHEAKIRNGTQYDSNGTQITPRRDDVYDLERENR
jgi:hypothetical protein